MIRCPFCNFETDYPVEIGKVYECLGECYSTYCLLKSGADESKARRRLVEIFFLDPDFNISADAEELDRCEFRAAEGKDPGQPILFARERRMSEQEIEALREGPENTIEAIGESIGRLRSSVDRFERYLNARSLKAKLLHQAQVIGRLAVRLAETIDKAP